MAGDHVDERGLAGPIGTNDADRLLNRNVERYVARRDDAAEGFLEIANREDRRHGVGAFSAPACLEKIEPRPSGRNRMVSSRADPRTISTVWGMRSTGNERGARKPASRRTSPPPRRRRPKW